MSKGAATLDTIGMPTAPAADAPAATYNASCHCGAFAYSVTISPPLDSPSSTVTECNCSICTRNSYLLVYVPNERVVFSKGRIEQFCVSKAVPFPFPFTMISVRKKKASCMFYFGGKFFFLC